LRERDWDWLEVCPGWSPTHDSPALVSQVLRL
jgi:hypothetical protein